MKAAGNGTQRPLDRYGGSKPDVLAPGVPAPVSLSNGI